MNAKKQLLTFLVILIFVSHLSARERSLQGIVKDKSTGEVLPFANLVFLQSNTGTATDNRGEFHFYGLIFTSDTLEISYMGYQSVKIPINSQIDFSRKLIIELAEQSIDLPEVSITAAKYVEPTFSMDPSIRRIQSDQIQIMPSVGLPDLFRTIQQTPGVTSNSEASNQLCVRGGNPDQNLVTIDGAVIYYPYHIFGITSFFNNDMVDNLIFSPGGFSAQYGDKLSSVLAIQTKTPVNNFPHRINLNIIGSDVTTGGKLGKYFGWLYSGRSSYIKIPNSFEFYDLPYDYYDQTLKLEFTPGEKHNVQFLTLHSKDDMNIDDEFEGQLQSSIDTTTLKYKFKDQDQLNWNNKLYSIKWQYFINNRTTLTAHHFNSQYINAAFNEQSAEFPDHMDVKFQENKQWIDNQIVKHNAEQGAEIKNRFTDATTKINLNHELNERVNLRGGMQHSKYKSDYFWEGEYTFLEEQFQLFFDHAPADSFNYEQTYSSRAGFLESDIRYTDKLSSRQGLRLTKWGNASKLYLEPRINLQYRFTDKLQFDLAYGRYSQGVTTALEEGIIGFLELYFPMDQTSSVETADHYIGTLGYTLSKNTKLRITGYYKSFDGLLKATDGTPRFAQTPGKAKGIEFEAGGKLFNMTGWCSYVWSHSDRTYNGLSYDTNFDQRHKIQAFTQMDMKHNTSLSAYWEFHTGQPYDPVNYLAMIPELHLPYPQKKWDNGTVWYQQTEMDVPRGRVRYPYYHRLDITVIKLIKRSKFTFAPYFSIRNVYNRANPIFYKKVEFDADFEDGKIINARIEREPYKISILPTVGFRWGF